MKRTLVIACGFALTLLIVGHGRARAAEPYAAFTAGAQAHRGLFTIWQKEGSTYLELAPNQLDTDFLETIVPGNGIGQDPVWWGDTDYLPTQIVRFERRGDSIVMLWRNWYAHAGSNPSALLANQANFPDSVVGLGKVAAQNPSTGNVIFDLSSLLADNIDLRNVINGAIPPDKAYRLDSSLSYFDSVKAFPENDVITVAQTWSTDASHVIDTAPDARRILMRVVYNFVQMPHDDYRPRLMDDRVGLYDDIYIDFSNDTRERRQLPYIVRWNFDPVDRSRTSDARHPMIIYLSDTVPSEYRSAIRDACLEWNKALGKIGILNGIVVRNQPADSNWDPDDVRYSVIRWLDETQPSFGADSQTLFDPLNGEEIRTGVLISAGVGISPRLRWKYLVDPVRYGRATDPVPPAFLHDAIFSTVVHEMGHNLGMQHNFIGHEAYTAAELQDTAFTRQHGITSTVMEYAPLNLWPQPYKQGEFFQTTIGPYDYYAIKFGYANIPGAQTPEQEVPTLRRWASAWSNPWTRYASDEDVDYATGHAADPRVEQGMLTNDPLSWCNVQMKMYREQIASLNRYWPAAGEAYEQERRIFDMLLRGYDACATTAAHYLGGQYLSWAHAGDSQAEMPIIPVSLETERRAMTILDASLFNPNALNVPPSVLNRLRYTEWSGYGYTGWEGYGNLPKWAYDPPDRHDLPLVEELNNAQLKAVDYLFQPLVLQRIDENPAESMRPTMTIADLFDWLHTGIVGNLHAVTIPLLSRNLQSRYVERLATIAIAPPKGTPPDAQALAQTELTRIARDAANAIRSNHDAVTSAHLAALLRAAKHPIPAKTTDAVPNM
ncbi:MAG: zinc-dependent metalloprotease [Candidatus Eremiobacteraeota bacterium]|nr:zinc-dependent metalloprotease [Candidatus Eremiobacteraeota bacterium]